MGYGLFSFFPHHLALSLQRTEHMAAQLHPSDILISTAQPSTTIPSPDSLPLDHTVAATPPHTNPPKRHRRPSLRLGDIGGDAHHDSQNLRPNKNWTFHRAPSLTAKPSKTRPIINGVNSRFGDSIGPPHNFADFSPRATRKPTKKARTNWNKSEIAASISNEGGCGGGRGINESIDAFEDKNDDTNTNEEFEPEGTGSPLLNEQQSPVNSTEHAGLQFWDQCRMRNRSKSNRLHQNEASWMNLGVREWLIGLGLGRYSPVFEIHEVDDEVLPMLTLEDLKDMGISAVGSRRKMYNSIRKLSRGFS